MIAVVDPNPINRSAMTTKDSNSAMGGAEKLIKTWKNEVTLKRYITTSPLQCVRHRILTGLNY